MTRPEFSYHGKKIVITGGSGFIGTHLTQAIIKLQAKVIVLDQRQPKLKSTQFIKGSITQPDVVAAAIKHRPHVVFHLAGLSGTVGLAPSSSFRVNCLGTLNLVEAIRLYSPHTTVALSNSRQEYGKAQYLPIDEHHPTQPTNHYGIHKLTTSALALIYHRFYHLKLVVLRTSNVFGPSTHKSANYNIVNQWLATAKNGRPITLFGRGNQLRDYLFIDDFIYALLRAGSSPQAAGQIINLGSGQGLTLAAMAKTISREFNTKIIHKPWPKDWKQAETGDYVTDITAAQKLLHWQPQTPFETGVRKCLEYSTPEVEKGEATS